MLGQPELLALVGGRAESLPSGPAGLGGAWSFGLFASVSESVKRNADTDPVGRPSTQWPEQTPPAKKAPSQCLLETHDSHLAPR